MARYSMPVMFLLLLSVACTGCASTDGPAQLVIAPSQYDAAFDAAVEAARREGMYATLVDRRSGIIETTSRMAGSLLEPWRQDNAGFAQAFENTLHQQQRHVRFEFQPADAPPVELRPDEPITGADVASLSDGVPDLTSYEGDIRLIATVAVDRQYRSGVQRDAWSRRLGSSYKIEGPDGDLPAQWWVTVSRDEAFERRLLAAVERAISANAEE